MNISPDNIILIQFGVVKISATLLFTWIVMVFLVTGSYLITRYLSSDVQISRGQNLLEILVSGLRSQIRDVSQQEAGPFLPFIGTLFIFILTANLLSVIPGFQSPTASLSTTTALAICVFVAVPVFGVGDRGWLDYLKQYTKPTIFMLPFTVLGEFSRTLALAVRLYGNMMSGSVIAAILLGFTPLFFPVVMQLFGLLTGTIQAYIFSILAMVYIASATTAHQQVANKFSRSPNKGGN